MHARMFEDRHDAGRQLSRKLSAYRGKNAIVLALPRGGVEIGYAVAQALQLPLDIIVTRKIGHPLHPEYAVGVVDGAGTRILNTAEAAMVDPQWLNEESARQQKEARRRIALYRGDRAPISLDGKIAILVDDGMATGFSMRLAVRSVTTQHPATIIVAVPVAARAAVADVRAEGAEVIVLDPPDAFASAVGAHYVRFDQVEDSEVIHLLHDSSTTV